MQKKNTARFNGENILQLFKNNWQLLLVFFVIGMIIAGLSKLVGLPKYEISGMFQVNNQQSGNMDDYQLNNLFNNGNSKAFDVTPPSVIVMVISTSPYILNQVIQDLNLEIEITPKLFPIVGVYSYYHFHPNSLKTLNWNFAAFNFSGLGRYAWGGEQINVEDFSVPQFLREKPFVLQVNDERNYSLFYNGKLVLRGTVQQTCGNASMGVSLRVNKIYARKGTEFILTRHSLKRVFQSLSRGLQVTEINKSQASTDHSGIVNISLTGTSPELQAQIVNRIMELLISKSLQDNTDRLVSVQNYIKKKLVAIDSEVQIAQNTVSAYRVKTNILDLDTQAKLLVSSLDDINRQLAQNIVTRGSLESMYGPKHPLMRSLQQQQQELQQNKQVLLGQIQKLPAQEARLAELENNLSVQQNLRDTLLKRNQELQILISGQLSNVKILSYASADGIIPLSSNTRLFALVGGILGVIAGIFIVLACWLLRRVTNPYELEKLGIRVGMVIRYCSIFSKFHKKNKVKVTTRQDYREYSNLFRDINSVSHYEIDKMTAEILLNEEMFRVTGVISMHEKSGASVIAHNLARNLFLAGKRVLLIHSAVLDDSELDASDLYDEVSGVLIGSKFIPVDGLSVYFLNPEFRLDIYNKYLQNTIKKESGNFDFIFVLDYDLIKNISRILNFSICTRRYLVTTQQISQHQLERDLDYLKRSNMEINGLFFSYNRRYLIHDLYSK